MALASPSSMTLKVSKAGYNAPATMQMSWPPKPKRRKPMTESTPAIATTMGFKPRASAITFTMGASHTLRFILSIALAIAAEKAAALAAAAVTRSEAEGFAKEVCRRGPGASLAPSAAPSPAEEGEFSGAHDSPSSSACRARAGVSSPDVVPNASSSIEEIFFSGESMGWLSRSATTPPSSNDTVFIPLRNRRRQSATPPLSRRCAAAVP
mmetsp:Transcript_92862/g.267140  ORF Transcript_92862/g.267140 Transcript_92862/m.267140 type:complete len:210 (+) Transcript_92862:891-1520(+)